MMCSSHISATLTTKRLPEADIFVSIIHKTLMPRSIGRIVAIKIALIGRKVAHHVAHASYCLSSHDPTSLTVSVMIALNRDYNLFPSTGKRCQRAVDWVAMDNKALVIYFIVTKRGWHKLSLT